MKQPSNDEVESAKEFLRQRLDAEHSMAYNLESLMREAAERIATICYAANVSPKGFNYNLLPLSTQRKIDEVIEWLRSLIDDYFRTLAIAEHTDTEDEVLPFILGENHGMTFDERLDDYCAKYKNELMVLIGAGLALGVVKSELAKSIGDNLKRPYDNALLVDGIDAPISYGQGRTNSMYTAIAALTKYGIETAWMRHWELSTAADGAIGWIVRRGSSYPCALCDDNCGFHPLADGTGLPVHNSCCCIAIPVYL